MKYRHWVRIDDLLFNKLIMDFIVFVTSLAAGILVWYFFANNLMSKFGRFPKHLVSIAFGFLAFNIVLINFITSDPSDSLESAAEPERAIQTAATKKDEAVKKAAAEKAKSDAKDRSSMASVVCKDYVRVMLKSPSSADFPLLDFKATKKWNQTYVIKSYVDSQNSFGANLRSHYQCEVQYIGGGEGELDSWKLHDLKIN